jgi:hypothetical protein
VSELDFGRQIVNRTGRDTGGLGKRRSDPDKHRLYRVPVKLLLCPLTRIAKSETLAVTRG